MSKKFEINACDKCNQLTNHLDNVCQKCLVKPKQFSVPALSDYNGSLGNLKSEIQKLIKEHGEKANVFFDAGHNNVEVVVKIN